MKTSLDIKHPDRFANYSLDAIVIQIRSIFFSTVINFLLTFSIINDYLDVDFDVYTGKYYPVVYLNDYWNLLADYYPINETFEYIIF